MIVVTRHAHEFVIRTESSTGWTHNDIYDHDDGPLILVPCHKPEVLNLGRTMHELFEGRWDEAVKRRAQSLLTRLTIPQARLNEAEHDAEEERRIKGLNFGPGLLFIGSDPLHPATRASTATLFGYFLLSTLQKTATQNSLGPGLPRMAEIGMVCDIVNEFTESTLSITYGPHDTVICHGLYRNERSGFIVEDGRLTNVFGTDMINADRAYADAGY